MDFPNSVIPEPLNTDNLVPTTNPFEISNPNAGLLDLALAPSISSPSPNRDPFANGIMPQGTASSEALAAPLFFDADKSQADRYINSEYFGQLGFNPLEGYGNEYKYGATQTWGDAMGNALGGAWQLGKNTFVEGWKGWGRLASAVGNWDASKLIADSPEELYDMNKTQESIMNKYAVFSTPEADAGGIFNKKFFGDMLQQSGFAIGTIAQFLSEELLTMGLSTEFSLAKLGLKAPQWMGKVVTKADVLKDMVKLGEDAWKSETAVSKLVRGAKKFVPLVGTADDIARYSKAGAGVLQLGAIGIGGARRFLAETNMAMTEARMEAAGTYGELYTKLYDEELNRTGQVPMADKIEAMKKTSMDAAHDNFWVNSGILMVSNRLQFDNMFKKFSVGREVLGEGAGYADNVLRVAGKDATKVYQKGKLGAVGLFKDVAKDFGTKRAAWEVAKPTAKNIFKWEASEGLQEIFQDLSNNTLQNYYYDLYHGVKGSDLSTNLSKAIDQEKQNNQGLKTFLMGALTGRLISPINMAIGHAKMLAGTTAEQRAQKKTDVKETVDLLNAFYDNPNKYLNEHIASIKIQNRVATNMDEALANRDKYQFQNNKDSGFARTVSAALKTDMFEPLMSTLEGYSEKFDDQQFKEAFGIERTQSNINSVNEFFSGVAKNVKDFHTTWKTLKERFSDLVMPDLYKEGTPERKISLFAKKALDDSIEMMATLDHKSKKAIERAVAIKSEMAKTPGYGGSVEMAFRTLGDIKSSIKEAAILQDEITTLEAGEKLDRATKQIIKAKKKQLAALENWIENHEALQSKGLKEKRRFNKANKAFTEYVNSKNEESDLDVVIKKDDFGDIYGNFLDYMELNKDHKDYIDAYNVLANPTEFVMMHDRLVDAMMKVEEKFKAEHKKEVADKLKNEGAEEGSLASLMEGAVIDEEIPEGSIETKDLEEKPETTKEEEEKAAELDVDALETELATEYKNYVEQRTKDGLRPASPSEFIRFNLDAAKILGKYDVDKRKIYIVPTGATAADIDNIEFKYGTPPPAPVTPSPVVTEEPTSTEEQPTEEIVDPETGEVITTPTSSNFSQEELDAMGTNAPTGTAITNLKVGNYTLGLGDKLVNGVDPEIQIIGFTDTGKIIVESQQSMVEVPKELIAARLEDGYTKLIKNPKGGKFTASQVNRRDVKQNPRKTVDNGYIPYVNQTRTNTLNQSNIKDGLDAQIEKKNEKVVRGKKVIDGAYKVNNRLDDFETTTDAKGKTKLTLTGINREYPLVMATDKINKGANLTIKVDVDMKDFDEYEYINSNIKQKRTKADYFTADGKIKPEMVSDFPIIITTEVNGKEVKLGHLPTERWVTAKFANGDTMHVVDKLDVDGVLVNNLAANVKKINDIRKEIMEDFNSGRATERQAIVSKKSDGVLRTESGLRKLTEVFHPTTKIAIIKNGVPYISAEKGMDDDIDNLIMPEQLSDKLASKDTLAGMPVVLVKTPTGKTLVSWVNVPTLKDEHIDFILEAWKAFHKLKNMNTAGLEYKTDSEEFKIVNAVYKAYGTKLEAKKTLQEDPEFKLLQDYVNDYITYTSPVQYDPSRKNSSQINILPDGTLITWAVESGKAADDKLVIKNLNQLTQDNQNKYYNKAAFVYYNVKFDGKNNTGINSQKKMNFLGVVDGKLVESPSMTYNEHMMNILETNLAPGIPVDSKDPNSDLVHFSNPVINFDFTAVTKAKSAEKKETDTVPQAEYDNFIDKGIVTEQRIDSIVEKVIKQQKLSPREMEIFSDKTGEINKKIAAKAAPVSTIEAKLSSNDKIIWGHPGLGKTTFKEQNPNEVLDFDTDFKPKVAELLGLPKNKQNSKGLNEWRNDSNETKFETVMRQVWKEALAEAKKTGKMLVVSDMMFLRENAKDFDKIITLDKKTFIKRTTERGDDITKLESWKSSIDKTISSIDQNKVIATNKYFAELAAPESKPISAKPKVQDDAMENEIMENLSKYLDEDAFTGARPLTEEEKYEQKRIIDAIKTKYAKADIEKRRKEELKKYDDDGGMYDDDYGAKKARKNAKYDTELAKELYKEMKAGRMITQMTLAEQKIIDQYLTTEVRKSVDEETVDLKELDFDDKGTPTPTFTEAPSTGSLEDQLLGADFGEGLTDFGDFDLNDLGDFEQPKKSIATKIENLTEDKKIKKDCK